METTPPPAADTMDSMSIANVQRVPSNGINQENEVERYRADAPFVHNYGPHSLIPDIDRAFESGSVPEGASLYLPGTEPKPTITPSYNPIPTNNTLPPTSCHDDHPQVFPMVLILVVLCLCYVTWVIRNYTRDYIPLRASLNINQYLDEKKRIDVEMGQRYEDCPCVVSTICTCDNKMP